MKKFTFKKEKAETGLASVANPYPDTQIKLNGKQIGVISAPSRFGHDGWRVRLIVRSDTAPGGWKWASLKLVRDTEPEIRELLQQNAALIQEKFDLFPVDEF
jgi:hypothetical protein